MSFDSAVPASPNIFSSRMKRRRGWGEEAEERDFFFFPLPVLSRGSRARRTPRSVSPGAAGCWRGCSQVAAARGRRARSRAELPLPLCSSSVGAERCPLPLFTAVPAPTTGTGEADDPASFLLLLLLSHPYCRQPFLSGGIGTPERSEAEKLRGVGQAGTRSCLAFFSSFSLVILLSGAAQPSDRTRGG